MRGSLAARTTVLPGAPTLPIGTSAAVGSVGRDVAVEAMEGFGVLRAAALAGVPAIEIRAISNEIGEPDRSPLADRRGDRRALGRDAGAARGDRRRRPLSWAQSSRIRTATSSSSFALPL